MFQGAVYSYKPDTKLAEFSRNLPLLKSFIDLKRTNLISMGEAKLIQKTLKEVNCSFPILLPEEIDKLWNTFLRISQNDDSYITQKICMYTPFHHFEFNSVLYRLWHEFSHKIQFYPNSLKSELLFSIFLSLLVKKA